MNATARKSMGVPASGGDWEPRRSPVARGRRFAPRVPEPSTADFGSLPDHLELDDLMTAVNAVADAGPAEDFDPTRASEDPSARGDEREFRDPGPHRTKLDLIAESKRIREECDDLVRRYQEAVGAERSPRPAATDRPIRETTREQGAPNAASRRKALLLLLIEELV